MPKHLVTLPRSSGMALDIVSYGRRGPGGTARLSLEQINQVKRTVGRVPEVMVKVSGGARDSGGVGAHLKYIGRHGKLELETDEGLSLRGRDVASHLIADWQLDLCGCQYRPKPAVGQRDTRAKLVHNIVLSMPAGTSAQKVLNAARHFARENFALQYRYAIVLHTDQAHPHVHLVVKCEHEFDAGKRLYIRKATLRQWREQFAALMREEGVAANATPRQLRGRAKSLKDPIHHRLRDLRAFHAMSPADRATGVAPTDSSFMRRKLEDIARELQSSGRLAQDTGASALASTRSAVMADWHATARALRTQGLGALADQVDRFARTLPVVRTDKELLASGLMQQVVANRQARSTRGVASHERNTSR